ncbi:hypothetical protein [Bacillus sp. 1NLA3E]|uniref:hypothetical protein n=1 Tax=Bacillus sp. 1NLA3E TaxID=666686 RepID=UPI0002FF01C3|nr:hypothetical protein [Bacillus sp. 1NLA3E]
MKQTWSKIFSIFFILMGIGLLLVVLRMVWFPPSSMGMMMGKNLMMHHVAFMFSQLLLFSFCFIGIFIIVWIVNNKGK